MKRLILYLVFIVFISCKKEKDSFIISLQETTPLNIVEFQQNIFVTLNYQHPDGYVGFSNPDQLSLEIKDSRLDSSDYYHLIPVNPPNHVLSVQGEILVEIDAPFIFGNGNEETVIFKIRIQDTNMQWSNYIETPAIIINKQ